jgi:hypothetical protein
MKLPWFKFYPADWLSDEALRSCSLEARGLWIDLMSLMAKSERYGSLLIGGRSATPEQLSRLTGANLEATNRLIKELEDCGVFSRDKNGNIFSRRMLRDQATREADRVRQYRHRQVTPKSHESHGEILDTRYQKLDAINISNKETKEKRPNREEWTEYAKSINWIGGDVDASFDHYESNGWKVGGKASVKDWRAAARNCHRRSKDFATIKRQTQQKPATKTQYKSPSESPPSWRVDGYESYNEWSKNGCKPRRQNETTT